MHGTTELEGLLLSIATGYFIWHMIISVFHVGIFGVSMVFHGVACLHGCDLRIRKHAQFYLHTAPRFPSLIVPSHLHRPFLHHYYPIFLFTESTNILRNLYYFLSKLNLSTPR